MAGRRFWVQWWAAGVAAASVLAVGPSVERLDSAGGLSPLPPSSSTWLAKPTDLGVSVPQLSAGFNADRPAATTTTTTVEAATTTSFVPAEGEEPVTAPKAANLPPEISPTTTIVPVAPPPSAAPSPTTMPKLIVPVGDDTGQYWEVVGQAALAQIGFPWQSKLPGWTIEFLPGRSGLLGGTWTYEKRIEIYVRDYQDVDEVAFTLAHELGHAVDVTMLSDADRETWRQTRAFSDPNAPWWVASGATDFSSGAGDWAESFAVWQIGGWSHSKLAGQPSNSQLAVLARLAR